MLYSVKSKKNLDGGCKTYFVIVSKEKSIKVILPTILAFFKELL